MRRVILLCLSALLLLLTACGGSRRDGDPSVFEKDGYTVDLERQTITHGEDVYTFSVSGGGSSSTIRIIYPNGASYFWTWSGNSGHGGWSDDYDPARYTDGDTLMALIDFRPEPEGSGGSPLLALLLLAVGLFDLISPRTAWYLGYGWRFKDAEPSDAALVLYRVGGVIAVLAALIVFFL